MFDFAQNIQKGIIYLFKSSESFHSQIVDIVKADYFEFDTQNHIYSIVKKYKERYKTLPTDDIILEEAKKRVQATNAQYPKVSDYKDELDDSNRAAEISYDNQQYYLDLIEEFAKNKALEEAIKDCLLLIREGRREEIEDTVKKAMRVSLNVDLGSPYYESFIDRWFKEENTERLATIWPTLDANLGGGISRKEFFLIVAPPGVGKSLTLVNLGKRFLMQNKKVLHISLEMSDIKTARRYDSIITNIPYDRIKAEGPKVQKRLQMFQEQFPDAELVIKEFPTRGASVNTIKSFITQLKNKQDFDPDVILIDYLELLNPSNDTLAEHIAQQRIAEELRGLAVELNKWLVVPTQTNREGAKVEIITDVHMADSYGKFRVVDLAISLNQTAEEQEKGLIRAYIMKARDAKQKYIIRTDVCYDTLIMTESKNQILTTNEVSSSEEKLKQYLDALK